MRPQKIIDGFPLSELNSVENTEEISQEDLSFSLDDDSNGPDGSPSIVRWSPITSTYGFSLDAESDRKEASKEAEKINLVSNYGSVTDKPEITIFNVGGLTLLEGNLKEPLKSMDPAPAKGRLEDASFSIVTNTHTPSHGEGEEREGGRETGRIRFPGFMFRLCKNINLNIILFTWL